MRVLALETCDRLGSLAALLSSPTEITLLGETQLPHELRTAQSLLPTVQATLDTHQWEPTSVDLVCVVTGPGSFTGLRIGVTAAKTFAYATGAALVGVHTLAALAAAVPTQPQRLWAILDAQRQELFAVCFSPDDSLADDPPTTQVVAIDTWLAQLAPGDAVVGPPLEGLRDRLPQGVESFDRETWKPQASLVGRLGIERYRRGLVTDPAQLAPQYYRRSAAEEKADGC